jgi:hypothetical protein
MRSTWERDQWGIRVPHSLVPLRDDDKGGCMRDRRGFLLLPAAFYYFVGAVIYTTALGWAMIVDAMNATCPGGFCGGTGAGGSF